jgi:hypothetical protein
MPQQVELEHEVVAGERRLGYVLALRASTNDLPAARRATRLGCDLGARRGCPGRRGALVAPPERTQASARSR